MEFYIVLALLLGLSAGVLLHQFLTDFGRKRVIGRRLKRSTYTDNTSPQGLDKGNAYQQTPDAMGNDPVSEPVMRITDRGWRQVERWREEARRDALIEKALRDKED